MKSQKNLLFIIWGLVSGVFLIIGGFLSCFLFHFVIMLEKFLSQCHGHVNFSFKVTKKVSSLGEIKGYSSQQNVRLWLISIVTLVSNWRLFTEGSLDATGRITFYAKESKTVVWEEYLVLWLRICISVELGKISRSTDYTAVAPCLQMVTK